VTELNWQIVATGAFIAIAVAIVLRRLIKLLSSPAAMGARSKRRLGRG
jgi:hypothetical protein